MMCKCNLILIELYLISEFLRIIRIGNMYAENTSD